jgi:hypothetical protein
MPQFLSQHSHCSRGLSQAFVDGRLQGLLGSYHQHAISKFNTCSRGSTHWSLTNTNGGYNLGGADLPHHTPQPSQPMVLHYPPMGPARSQVIHPIITNWTKRRSTLISRAGLLHSTSTIAYLLSIAMTNGKPPR